MKKSMLFSLSVVMVIFSSCKWIEDDSCKAVDKADLVVDTIHSNLTEEQQGSKVFKIISSILNTVKGLADCEVGSVPKATSNTYLQEILYSKTNSFNGAKSVDKIEFKIPETNANESKDVSDTIKFNVDGFYKIEGTADFYNTVSERNENNNLTATALGQRRNTEFSYSGNSLVIEIKGTSLKPKVNINGKEIYVTRDFKK